MRDRRPFVLAALIACGAVLLPSGAEAGRYDGTWSMTATTTRGHCGTIPVGMRIKRGRISSTGGSYAFYPIQLIGRVSRSGRVILKATTGPRVAHGRGAFNGNQASGTWKGSGPSGLCSGVWNAVRQ